MRVERDRVGRMISTDQEAYVNQILHSFHVEAEKGISTPIEPCTELLRRLGSPTLYPESGKPTSHDNTEEEEEADQKTYQKIVGSLNYAATAPRPDIAFAVGILGRFAVDPARMHMHMVIRIIRYLKKTAGYLLILGDRNGNQGVSACITLYTDSDFLPEIQTHKVNNWNDY